MKKNRYVVETETGIRVFESPGADLIAQWDKKNFKYIRNPNLNRVKDTPQSNWKIVGDRVFPKDRKQKLPRNVRQVVKTVIKEVEVPKEIIKKVEVPIYKTKVIEKLDAGEAFIFGVIGASVGFVLAMVIDKL